METNPTWPVKTGVRALFFSFLFLLFAFTTNAQHHHNWHLDDSIEVQITNWADSLPIQTPHGGDIGDTTGNGHHGHHGGLNDSLIQAWQDSLFNYGNSFGFDTTLFGGGNGGHDTTGGNQHDSIPLGGGGFVDTTFQGGGHHGHDTTGGNWNDTIPQGGGGGVTDTTWQGGGGIVDSTWQGGGHMGHDTTGGNPNDSIPQGGGGGVTDTTWQGGGNWNDSLPQGGGIVDTTFQGGGHMGHDTTGGNANDSIPQGGGGIVDTTWQGGGNVGPDSTGGVPMDSLPNCGGGGIDTTGMGGPNGGPDTTGHTFHMMQVGNQNTTVATASVYPNPMVESATIQISNTSGSVTFKMVDLSGKMAVVKTGVPNGNMQLNRGDLNAGVYIYQILDGNNVVSSGKIVLQ